MTQHLNKDEWYTLLTLNVAGANLYFLKAGTGTTGTTFTRHPGNQPVNPIIEEMESTESQDVTIDTSNYIADNNANTYNLIVGGRPKGKARR